MKRIAYFAAAAALCVAQGAGASPGRLDADVFAVRGLDGIQQQGRGGGKQEDGARGQGQGSGGSARQQGGGRNDDRPAARQQQGGGREKSGSASQESRGQGGGNSARSGGSSQGNDDRGSSSASSRGNSGNGGSSATARGNSGNNRGSASDDDSRGNSGNGNASANGNGSGNGNGNGSGVARGRGEPGRGRLSDDDLRRHLGSLPANVQALARSQRANDRMVAGALARGRARGADVNAFDVRTQNGAVRILNRRGDLLLDLDEDRARNLGGWDMRRLGDRQPTGNAPAFCRSGEGHPVGGRQWCLDKGFGLGSRNGTIWSRGGIDDVIWRRGTDDRLDRGGLIGTLGDIVFGRLALQAVTLGYDQPLTGYWVSQPEGPRLLRVRSGEYEVAEFYDGDRDDRVDVLYVVQPVW